MTAELWLFDPKPVSQFSTGIYSNMKLDETGRWRSPYGGQTLEDLISESKVSPEAVLIPWEEAEAKSLDLARQKLCKGPQRITEQRWWELLEVLYPARWEHLPDGEVFMMPECITSYLYTFGVRVGSDYFAITEDCRIKTADLIQQCKDCMEAE